MDKLHNEQRVMYTMGNMINISYVIIGAIISNGHAKDGNTYEDQNENENDSEITTINDRVLLCLFSVFRLFM